MTHRSPTRRRALSAAVLAAGLGVTSLAGCGNGVEASTDAAPTRTVSATPTPSDSPSASGSSTDSSSDGSSGSASDGTSAEPTSSGSGSGSSGSSGSSSSGPPICSVRILKVFETPPAGNGGGTAGSIYTILNFENIGSTTCVVDGHPGVSFVGKGSGTQLGRGATFLGPTKRVALPPGGQARSQLRIASPGAYGDQCAPVAADGFRVYPPDSKASVFVREGAFRACSKRLPDGRSQLSVTAVGTVQ